jgi:hypothetical protein
VPLGRAFATSSGDNGGNANLGIWAKTPSAYAFLREFLTVGKMKELLPDCAPFAIERYELPNLLHDISGFHLKVKQYNKEKSPWKPSAAT